MDELNDIALFVEVVHHGSFSEAGRRLGVPANTVSRRIQDLETRLGTRLLQRSTRKLALTDAGRTFYDRCATAVGDLVSAARDLAADSQTPSGLVRVATGADFFEFFPMERFEQFLGRYPRLRLEFVLSDKVVDLIAEGVDVAFRSSGPTRSGYATHLVTLPIVGLVASPKYLAARGVPATLGDLADHDCLVLPAHGGRSIWRLRGADGIEHEVAISGRFAVNTSRGAYHAAIAGLGITLVGNTPAILADLAAGRLARVLPEYHRHGVHVGAVLPSRGRPPLAVATLIEAVRDWGRTAFPAAR